MICYVFTCQTVPLFFTVTKFGIALPKWIIERENSIWVNYFFMFLFHDITNTNVTLYKVVFYIK